MNLYNLHDHPESIHNHDKADKEIPDIFWDKYKKNPAELKKREAALAKSSKYSSLYANDIIHGPFPLGEPAIATDPYRATDYAILLLKGRFKLAEPTIAKNSYMSYLYALHILKGPFKAAEPAIAKDPEDSWGYARNILNKPFKLGEPAITTNHYILNQYNEYFHTTLKYTG